MCGLFLLLFFCGSFLSAWWSCFLLLSPVSLSIREATSGYTLGIPQWCTHLPICGIFVCICNFLFFFFLNVPINLMPGWPKGFLGSRGLNYTTTWNTFQCVLLWQETYTITRQNKKKGGNPAQFSTIICFFLSLLLFEAGFCILLDFALRHQSIVIIDHLPISSANFARWASSVFQMTQQASAFRHSRLRECGATWLDQSGPILQIKTKAKFL